MIDSYTKYKYLLTMMNCLLKNEYKAIAICKTDDEINELRGYIDEIKEKEEGNKIIFKNGSTIEFVKTDNGARRKRSLIKPFMMNLKGDSIGKTTQERIKEIKN